MMCLFEVNSVLVLIQNISHKKCPTAPIDTNVCIRSAKIHCFIAKCSGKHLIKQQPFTVATERLSLWTLPSSQSVCPRGLLDLLKDGMLMSHWCVPGV